MKNNMRMIVVFLCVSPYFFATARKVACPDQNSLEYAVTCGKDMKKLLLALPQMPQSQKDTLLHRAIFFVNVPAVTTLLAHGAHANALDDEGTTPLHTVLTIAPMSGVDEQSIGEIIRLLVRAGAEPSIKNREGVSVNDLVAQYIDQGLLSSGIAALLHE